MSGATVTPAAMFANSPIENTCNSVASERIGLELKSTDMCWFPYELFFVYRKTTLTEQTLGYRKVCFYSRGENADIRHRFW
jgi:hypothetical protein